MLSHIFKFYKRNSIFHLFRNPQFQIIHYGQFQKKSLSTIEDDQDIMDFQVFHAHFIN